MCLRFILKGFQKLAGGRRQAHHRSMKHGDTHPEGMPEGTNLGPLSGSEPNFRHRPVVALCLPPATFLNRFAVNRKKQKDDHETLQSCFGRTRALHLSMNRFSHQPQQIRGLTSPARLKSTPLRSNSLGQAISVGPGIRTNTNYFQRSAAGQRFIVGPQNHGQKDVGQKNGCYFSAHTFFCPERPRS